ncbi:unnamed protein product, partial [Tetraodon nigroviridis]
MAAGRWRAPPGRARPELLLRQHSMPASTASGDADSHRAYRGLVAGANHGKITLLRRHTLRRNIKAIGQWCVSGVQGCTLEETRSRGCRSLSLWMKPRPRWRPASSKAFCLKRCRQSRAAAQPLRGRINRAWQPTSPRPESNKGPRREEEGVVRQGGSPPPSYQQAVGVKVHKPSKNSLGGTPSRPLRLWCRGTRETVVQSHSREEAASQSEGGVNGTTSGGPAHPRRPPSHPRAHPRAARRRELEPGARGPEPPPPPRNPAPSWGGPLSSSRATLGRSSTPASTLRHRCPPSPPPCAPLGE